MRVRGVLAAGAVLVASSFCAGEGVIWTEATAGGPGEQVVVIVKATTETPVTVIEAPVLFDTAALTLLSVDFSRSPIIAQAANYGTVPGTPAGQVRARIALYIGGTSDTNIFPATENWEVFRMEFRVRSRALPGECQASVVAQAGLASMCFFFGGLCAPMELRPGTVTVLPAAGPLPPDSFAAVQNLREVRLSWENVASYDTLSLTRDGEPCGELANDAASYLDDSPPVGTHTYTLGAHVAGVAATPVSVEIVVVPPIVEPVRSIACAEDGSIAWQNAREYTRIDVKCNGTPLAVLAGSAVSYVDAAPFPGMRLYEIVAAIDDMASVPVTCLVGAVPTIRLWSVSVAHDEREIVVPVFMTHPFELQGFQVTFPLDPTRFGRKGFSLDGTLLEGRDNDMMWVTQPHVDNASIFGLGFCAGPCWSMPQAVDACYGKIILERKWGGLAPGDMVPLKLLDGLGQPPLCNILIWKGRSIQPELIDGEITIGQPKTPAVEDLAVGAGAARKGPDDLRLTWRNAAVYDRVQVERNGRLLAELPGGAQSFDDAISGGGVYWYRVRGVRNGSVSPWNLVIFTDIAGVELFRRGDANADGAVNIADGIRVLMHLFRDAPAPCEDAFDTNDDGVLDLGDAIYTFAYVFAGGRAPASPGVHMRWYDPTSDALDCVLGTP